MKFSPAGRHVHRALGSGCGSWIRDSAVLRLAHPRGLDYTEVRLSRLRDLNAAREEIARIGAKTWVSAEDLRALARVVTALSEESDR